MGAECYLAEEGGQPQGKGESDGKGDPVGVHKHPEVLGTRFEGQGKVGV